MGRKEREGKGEKAFVVFLVVGSNFSSFGFRERPSLSFASPPLRGGFGSGRGRRYGRTLLFAFLFLPPPRGERKNQASLGGLPSGRRSAGLGRGGGRRCGVHSFLRSVFPSRGRPRRRCELFGTGSDDGPVGGRRRSGSTFSRETVKGLGRTFSFTQREPAQSPISFLLPSPALPFFEEGREGSVRRRKRRSFSS